MASQKKYLTKNIRIEIDPVEGSTCAKEQRLLKESPGKKVHPGSDSNHNRFSSVFTSLASFSDALWLITG